MNVAMIVPPSKPVHKSSSCIHVKFIDDAAVFIDEKFINIDKA